MIDLYTSPTPNGWKVSMGLEEMEIAYETHIIDLSKGAAERLNMIRTAMNVMRFMIGARDC